MYIQYDLDTKKVTGYHETRLDDAGDEVLIQNVPENVVYVDSSRNDDMRSYFRIMNVNDTDVNNKLVESPADLITSQATLTMVEQLQEEGREIVQYLETYLNTFAEEYGYKDYHSAMLFKDSTVPKFKLQGQTFFDCTEAIWEYFEVEKHNFVSTGHPNLAEVKVAHPKFETYKTW